MGLITWEQRLELGNAELDAEHRKLVDLVNQLAKGIVEKMSRESYESLLDQLLAQAQAHFAHEEALMARNAYPLAEEHRSEHQRLVRDFQEHRKKFGRTGDPSVSLLYFFDQWLTRHIVGLDRDLIAFLAKGPSAAPKAGA